MPVFYDYPLDSALHVRQRVSIAGHKRYPFLAVAWEGKARNGQAMGIVEVYDDEGTSMGSGTLQRSSSPAFMLWHPTLPVLAVAWQNGEVTTYNQHTEVITEASLFLPHEERTVIFLLWSDVGNKLVTADSAGSIIVWDVNYERGLDATTPYMRLAVPDCSAAVIYTAKPTAAQRDADLRKRAMSGDEKALDMFMIQSRLTTLPQRVTKPTASREKRQEVKSREPLALYVATSTGEIHFCTVAGEAIHAVSLDKHIRTLMYYQPAKALLAMTQDQNLFQFSVEEDGGLVEGPVIRMGSPSPPSLTWTVNGVVAIDSHQRTIRMWNVSNGESYELLGMDSGNTKSLDFIDSHTLTPGVMIAGTDAGHVLLWWYVGTDRSAAHGAVCERDESSLVSCWQSVDGTRVSGPIDQVACVGNQDAYAYTTGTNVVMIKQGTMSACYNGDVCAVQVGAGRIIVESILTEDTKVRELLTDIHAHGIHATAENVLLWNGQQCAVYGMAASGSFKTAGALDLHGSMCLLFRQSVLLGKGLTIKIVSFSGALKQTITLLESEGECELLTISDPYLLVATKKKVIRVYDLSRREPRSVRVNNVGANLDETVGDFYSVQCNSVCTCVSFQFKRENSDLPDSRLFVWDFESEDVSVMDFSKMLTGILDSSERQEPLSNADGDVLSLASGRFPLSHFWDRKEPKLMICECARVGVGDGAASVPVSRSTFSPRADMPRHKVDVVSVVMFFTGEHGFMLQDCFPAETNYTGLLGLCAPYILYSTKPMPTENNDFRDSNGKVQSVVARPLLRDFKDLDNATLATESTRSALVDFSFHLTLGNLDEAFGKIRKIKGKEIWTNLARMCVKRQRLDVAKVCLANLGNCRALRAIRLATEKHPEPEVHLATLALHLDMDDEAIELYKRCERFDLLVRYYQNIDEWDEAKRVAEEYNQRILLRNLSHREAVHAESMHQYDTAIELFEAAGTDKVDVPRMFADTPGQWEHFVNDMSPETDVYRQWGAYLESIGAHQVSIQYYERSKDTLRHVQALCYMGNLNEAAMLCNQRGCKAACHFFAKHLEMMNKPRQATRYFLKALSFSNAIRIALENQYDEDLTSWALRSTKEDMVTVAEYFESNGNTTSAITLYQKGGAVAKAIDLAFRCNEFAALEAMADELDENTDPALLQRCADFFTSNGEFERAVPVLLAGKRYLEAVELCQTHRIEVTVEMAEKMTLPRSENAEETQFRNTLLERVGQCCEDQGAYRLACKKYNLAGLKIKAMKALLKSRDYEAIRIYAINHRRQDILMMAGNWLQQQNWKEDPAVVPLLKEIYKKARAYDSLAAFFQSAAQVQVEELRNYEQALDSLEEAQSSINMAISRKRKAGDGDSDGSLEAQAEFVENKMAVIRQFLEARKLLKEDPEEGTAQCRALIENDVDRAVQLGDIYCALVEEAVRRRDGELSYSLMQEMRAQLPSVNIAEFIPMSVIERVHRALGIPLGRGWVTGATADTTDGPGEAGGDEDAGDDIGEEDIDEELED